MSHEQDLDAMLQATLAVLGVNVTLTPPASGAIDPATGARASPPEPGDAITLRAQRLQALPENSPGGASASVGAGRLRVRARRYWVRVADLNGATPCEGWTLSDAGVTHRVTAVELAASGRKVILHTRDERDR
jgi:hypothetical protein